MSNYATKITLKSEGRYSFDNVYSYSGHGFSGEIRSVERCWIATDSGDRAVKMLLCDHICPIEVFRPILDDNLRYNWEAYSGQEAEDFGRRDR